MRASQLVRTICNVVGKSDNPVQVAVACGDDRLDMHEIELVRLEAHPLYPKQRVVVIQTKGQDEAVNEVGHEDG
jgi:hypothetical protein